MQVVQGAIASTLAATLLVTGCGGLEDASMLSSSSSGSDPSVWCVGGMVLCQNACTDLDTDPNNCGSCANACAPGWECDSGTCQLK